MPIKNILGKDPLTTDIIITPEDPNKNANESGITLTDTTAPNTEVDSAAIKGFQAELPQDTMGKEVIAAASQSQIGGASTKKEEVEVPEFKDINKSIGSTKEGGAGTKAAIDTTYSWDKTATSMAQNQYQQDVLAKKQEALTNRQTIESNAQAYQQQADMMKYTQQQAAEKVGWAGGYVLDQNRQMDYLKASIQAQMYGAMELQKYGYDSALAAARLSYDLNQQQFAQQYYEQAVSQALSEAQLTGTYFSAETKDMMAQRDVAEQVLKEFVDETGNIKIPEGTQLNQEQQQALNIYNNIKDWFNANNVSDAGVKTLAAWQAEESNNLAWTEFKWTQQQAALQATKEDLLTNPDKVIQVDNEGNTIFKEDGTVAVFDFSTKSAAEWIEYGSSNTVAKEQVYGHIESIINQTALEYSEKDTSITQEELVEKLQDAITKYLGDEASNDFFKDYKEDIYIGNTKAISGASIQDIINGNVEYSYSPTKPQTGTSKDVLGSYSFSELSTEYTLEKITGISKDPSKKYDDDIDVNIGGKNYDLDIDWYGGNGQGIKDEEQFNTDKATIRDLYPNITNDDFVVYNGRVWFYSSERKTWGVVQTNVGGKKLYDDLQYAKESGEDPERWDR